MTARQERHLLGIALDGTMATAVWSSSARDRSEILSTPCDATPRAIAHAFSEIARGAQDVGAVRVTLLRPLANVRSLEFPRMPTSALEHVLSRDWARHVIAGTAAGENYWTITQCN